MPRDRAQGGRDGAAPLLTRLPGAVCARRGLEATGLQTSQAESSARAKFLEEKDLRILFLLNGSRRIHPFFQIATSLLRVIHSPHTLRALEETELNFQTTKKARRTTFKKHQAFLKTYLRAPNHPYSFGQARRCPPDTPSHPFSGRLPTPSPVYSPL